jgi:protein tyrosine phosphatase
MSGYFSARSLDSRIASIICSLVTLLVGLVNCIPGLARTGVFTDLKQFYIIE